VRMKIDVILVKSIYTQRPILASSDKLHFSVLAYCFDESRPSAPLRIGLGLSGLLRRVHRASSLECHDVAIWEWSPAGDCRWQALGHALSTFKPANVSQ